MKIQFRPTFIFLLLCGNVFIMVAQVKEGKPSLSISGYVKTDVYYDTRQMEALREGHVALYPKAPSPDINGKDINSAPSLNFQAIQTRLRGDFKTDSVFNASITGAVEAEFYGVSTADVNGLRLRHAYGKMRWTHTELLVGQFWHPFFVPECSPVTQSFNTGIPFQPFARNPQIRVTQTYKNLKIVAAVMSERDYTSNGPNGAVNDYQRNAGIPMSDIQVQLAADSGRILLGAGLDYKQLRPELVTPANVYTNERVNALSYMVFAKYEVSKFYIRTQASLLENSYDFVGIGGYASTSYDPVTKINTYTSLRTGNVWTDIQLLLGNFRLGVFAGYSKNLGATKNILASPNYARAKNMDDLYRISPRIVYQKSKVSMGLEMEYDKASFGTPTNKGKVQNTSPVSNLRTLLAFWYFF